MLLTWESGAVDKELATWISENVSPLGCESGLCRVWSGVLFRQSKLQNTLL